MNWNRTRAARALVLAVVAALAAQVGAGVAAGSTPEAAGKEPTLNGVVNVNTATVEELQLLPGIGEARAQAVVDMRKKRGGFKSVDELLEVKGIGPSGLQRLRPHVTLTGRTTARAN